MARRKRGSAEQPIGVGLTTKQMKRRKPLSSEYLLDIEPVTDNQKKFFDAYAEGKHLVAYGCAGTGKTFITLYNALCDVLDENSPYDNLEFVNTIINYCIKTLNFKYKKNDREPMVPDYTIDEIRDMVKN